MEQNNINKSNRIVWLDSLKGLAILSVVLGHALLGVQEINAFPAHQQMISLIKDWIYTWHMPLFFVLSGAAFRISCLKDGSVDFQKIRKNALNLFILYLIFDTILPVMKMIFARFVNNPVTLLDLGRTILLPNTLMWYLWVLIIYYFGFGLLFQRKGNFVFIFAILLCLSLVTAYLYEAKIFTELCIKNLLFCSVFFYIGICFKELTHIAANKVIAAISGGLIVLNIIYMAGTYLIREYRNPLIDALLLEINAFLLIIVLVYIFQKIDAIEKNPLLIFLGKNSLVIYLLHTYFVTAMRVVLLRIGVSNAFIVVTLCTVIPLMITVGISLLVPRIAVLQYIFRPILVVDKFKKKK